MDILINITRFIMSTFSNLAGIESLINDIKKGLMNIFKNNLIDMRSSCLRPDLFYDNEWGVNYGK